MNTAKGDVGFTRLAPGDTVRVELPHSEVCMHMGIAGSVREVEVTSECRSGLAMAQILDPDGRPFGAPVTPGEAGIFSDRHGFYAFVSLEEPMNQSSGESGPSLERD